MEPGDYIKQQINEDNINYGRLINRLKNGSYRAVTFSIRDGSTAGNAVIKSTKDWVPEPNVIEGSEIPDKIKKKIDDKASKYLA